MELDIAIVGGGPSATYALDRLSAVLLSKPPEVPVRIGVFEKTGRFGCGAMHSDRQPTTSYMNRASADIALGADAASAGPDLPLGEVPFLDWARNRGFDAFGRPSSTPLAGDATPSRALHGAALASAFSRYVDRIEHNGLGHCHLFEAEVADIRRTTAEGTGEFRLAGTARRTLATARYVLLVTGHTQTKTPPDDVPLERAAKANGGLAYLPNAYPLSQLADLIEIRDAAICIKGMGLTAIDLILYLTEGQGGHFVRGESGNLRYVAAGAEPRYLTAISPSGCLVTARPRNEKAAAGARPYKGVFFTRRAVDTLRLRRGKPAVLPGGLTRRQLDFEADVLPLIVLEMAYVFYGTGLGRQARLALRKAAANGYARFLEDRGGGGVDIDAFIGPLHRTALDAGVCAHFDWRRLFFPSVAGPEVQEAVLDLAEADLQAARAGNLSDPAKSAADAVWRDLRSVHNHVLDFGGLTPASEVRFQQTYLRVYHRTSNGCCREAMEKIIALCRAGLVDVSHGPRATVEYDPAVTAFAIRRGDGTARQVDTVVSGHLRRFDPETDLSPLYANMRAGGLVSLWRNGTGASAFVPGAIAITADHHPIGRHGRVEPALTLVGTPIDGVKYFQQTAARPNTANDILTQLTDWALFVTGRLSQTGRHATLRRACQTARPLS